MKIIYLNYKITNLINGKVYIGAHKTDNENDGYLCSAGDGVEPHFWNAVRKYEPGCEGLSSDEIKSFYAKKGFINFKKETIDYYDNEVDMYIGEALYIKIYDSTNPEKGYNKTPGGKGGWDYINSLIKSKSELGLEILKKRLEAAMKTSKSNHGGVYHLCTTEMHVLIEKVKHENGYYLTEEHRKSIQKWVDSCHTSESQRKSCESRKKNGYYESDSYKESRRIAEEKMHADDGYYNSEEFKKHHERALESNRNNHGGVLSFNTEESINKSLATRKSKYGDDCMSYLHNNKEFVKSLLEPYVFEKNGEYSVHIKRWRCYRINGYKRVCHLNEWDSYCAINNINKEILISKNYAI